MKAKQILAIAGIILLLALYGSTLVFALMNNSASEDLLKASIAATIIIPVLLYAYQLVYKVIKKKNEENL